MDICAFEWKSVCGEDLSYAPLEKFGKIRYYGRPEDKDLPEIIGESEAVLCSKVPFTASLMDACPNLKYIGVTATGYNNVDLQAAKKRGITVTNIPDYSSDAVAQMTLTFILQFATSFQKYTDSTARGDWTRSEIFCYYPYPLTELGGKTLGLVGMGNIGKKVARLAEAFGMKVIYTARSKKDLPYEYVSLDEVLERADYVSLHLPASAETEKMICRESLAKMKKSAFLINTARGALVNEEDMRTALDEGVIAGYGADCLTVEPQSENCPLIGAKNCLLTPHVAWAPKETRARLIGILAENLEKFLEGKPQNVVNP
ncbi:MAG: D-2-hydroxyacid dehydrogenase [Clostridia bacterium]|nr:D-2-hydroxyacid dehydrogenase [Clostridia bacterium]